MKLPIRLLFLSLIMSFSVSVLAQKSDPAAKSQKEESSKTEGLRKVPARTGQDEMQESIEASVAEAMKEVEVSLKNMELELEALNVNLAELDFDLEPMNINIPEINIPELDFDIEPIMINIPEIDIDLEHLEDLDIDIDAHRFDWDNDHDDHFFDKDKDKSKDKSDKEDKSKGLKKIN